MFEPQYSDHRSEAFWEVVNLLDSLDYQKNGSPLYRLGCDLQELEGEVLKAINGKIRELERRLARKKSNGQKRKTK